MERSTTTRRAVLASATTAMTLLAGCGGGQPDPSEVGGETTTETELQTEATVTINDESQFDPMVTEVSVGATVEWVSEDSNYMSHQVKSLAKLPTVGPDTLTENGTPWQFQASLIRGGDGTTHTFEEPGVYGFFSQRGEPEADDQRRGWETICGVVVVGDAELSEPLPCEEN